MGAISSDKMRILKDHASQLIDSVQRADLPNGFIHGDAQRKNAIRTRDGAVWIDFEESSYGPHAWDLACLTMHQRFHTDRVLDLYADLSGSQRISDAEITTLKHLRDLEAVTWMLAIQNEREPEFKVEAESLLQDVLRAISVD